MSDDPKTWREWFEQAKRHEGCPGNVDMRPHEDDYEYGYDVLVDGKVVSTRTKHDGITQASVTTDVVEVVECLRTRSERAAE